MRIIYAVVVSCTHMKVRKQSTKAKTFVINKDDSCVKLAPSLLAVLQVLFKEVLALNLHAVRLQ